MQLLTEIMQARILGISQPSLLCDCLVAGHFLWAFRPNLVCAWVCGCSLVFCCFLVLWDVLWGVSLMILEAMSLVVAVTLWEFTDMMLFEKWSGMPCFKIMLAVSGSNGVALIWTIQVMCFILIFNIVAKPFYFDLAVHQPLQDSLLRWHRLIGICCC